MASKIQDDSIKLRDVINVSHGTLFRGSSPLELGDRYWSMRDAIIQAELLIMRMIKFQFATVDPQKVMNSLLIMRGIEYPLPTTYD